MRNATNTKTSKKLAVFSSADEPSALLLSQVQGQCILACRQSFFQSPKFSTPAQLVGFLARSFNFQETRGVFAASCSCVLRPCHSECSSPATRRGSGERGRPLPFKSGLRLPAAAAVRPALARARAVQSGLPGAGAERLASSAPRRSAAGRLAASPAVAACEYIRAARACVASFCARARGTLKSPDIQ